MNKLYASALMLASLLQTSTVFANCLDDASKFAERICGELNTRGTTNLLEANGQLKADVSGIVKKVVGEGSASINGKYLKEAYENVLRSDLAKELSDNRSCRKEMAKAGLSHACTNNKKETSKTPNATANQIPEKNIIEGTNIKLNFSRTSLDNELKKIGAICEWTLNKEGASVCHFTNIQRGLPSGWMLVFKNEKISQINSTFHPSYSEGENGKYYSPKKSSRGSKAEVNQYCSDDQLKKYLSSVIGAYGEPISPPQITTTDHSSERTQETCNGRRTKSCRENLYTRTNKYVFRVSSGTLLQFTWQQHEGSRNIEFYGDQIDTGEWGGCEFWQSFVFS